MTATPTPTSRSSGTGRSAATLAILLGQLGRSVVVLERWPEPYPLPRAVHFDDEVGRILQSCGIGDELRRITEPAEVYEWRNAAGTTLLRFGRVGDGPSGWPLSSMFNQPDARGAARPAGAGTADGRGPSRRRSRRPRAGRDDGVTLR